MLGQTGALVGAANNRRVAVMRWSGGLRRITDETGGREAKLFPGNGDTQVRLTSWAVVAMSERVTGVCVGMCVCVCVRARE